MKYILSFFAVVVICLSVFLFKEDKKQEYFQIHIIANSCSEKDQSAKREVENAVVLFLQDKISMAKSLEEAKNATKKSLNSIENISTYVLRNNGFDYGCSVEVKMEILPTQLCNNFVIEAGKYETLIIKLGDANGDNLWRVFPVS